MDEPQLSMCRCMDICVHWIYIRILYVYRTILRSAKREGLALYIMPSEFHVTWIKYDARPQLNSHAFGIKEEPPVVGCDPYLDTKIG